MENPKQTTYAPEELFTLKPLPFKTFEAKPATPSLSVTDEIPTFGVPSKINNSSYWDKSKWYVIGGAVMIGCISLVIYIEGQNSKKKGQRN